jgi:heme-degrading monooxygenase HmoA
MHAWSSSSWAQETTSTIRALAEDFDPLYRAQTGFQELYVLADDLSGEYGSFSLWDSKHDAEAANAAIAPQLQRALAGRLQGAPNRWLFQVIEPTQSSYG